MCTNLLVSGPATVGEADPKLYVSARTLELSKNLASTIYQVPRGQSFPLVSLPFPQLTWTNTYGFVGVGNVYASGEPLAFMDGMNEAGLSVAALWLPGTAYPAPGSDASIAFTDFAAWMLGNYASAAEIVQALTSVNVVGPAAGTAGYLPLHFIATDAEGQSVVIEFVPDEAGAAQMVVYGPGYQGGATSNGVLTNAPSYDKHLETLAPFRELSVIGPATSTSGTGPPVGGGLIGLPGDPTSISRFIRASVLRQGLDLLPTDGSGWLPAPVGGPFAGPVQTLVNTAFSLVQIVMGTPYGMLLEGTKGTPPYTVGDYTQWSVARDHTNRAYYFTSAFNDVPRVIDLAAIDFSTGSTFPGFATIPLNPPSPGWPWAIEVQFVAPAAV